MPQILLLDTQAYVQLGLNFENPKLIQLVELIKSGEVQLLITEVIRREIEADLKERSEEIWRKCKDLAHDIERKGAASYLEPVQAALRKISEADIQATRLCGAQPQHPSYS